nr:10114_t:CDS:2 [Entrophospora candida]
MEVAIVLSGKYKKVVIARNFDDGTKEHPYGHAIVVEIERYPLKIDIELDYGAKRDRSNGYDPSEHVKIYEGFEFSSNEDEKDDKYAEGPDMSNIDSACHGPKTHSMCDNPNREIGPDYIPVRNQFWQRKTFGHPTKELFLAQPETYVEYSRTSGMTKGQG